MKNINIDWNDVSELKKLLNQVKCRVVELTKLSDPEFVSKNERNRIVFENCINIMDYDISTLYKSKKLDPEPKYYVYAHCDPGFKIAVKKEGRSTFAATLGMEYMPFYIGKGTGNRAYELNRNDSHRKKRQKLKHFNNDIDVKILINNLTEKEALMQESKLIDIFGTLAQGGKLVNLDEGLDSKQRQTMYMTELKNISHFHKSLTT